MAVEPGPMPVVLVGGRSRRFGEDKLQVEIDGRRLVDRAVAALRAATGRPVALVGDCDRSIRDAADEWFGDDHPGIGPIGGIATALRHAPDAVMVLAGDMVAIDESTVRSLLRGHRDHPEAAVVLAVGASAAPRHRHPCTAIWTARTIDAIERSIRAGRHGLLELIDTLPTRSVVEVVCSDRALRNVNRPEDLIGLDAAEVNRRGPEATPRATASPRSSPARCSPPDPAP